FLVSAAGKLGISLSDEATTRLLHYAAELERWNRVYNLTGADGVTEILGAHIVDSLSLLTLQSIPKAGKILDIGTGAGLPGIVLAILLPETEIHMLEANGKKVRFLKNMVLELGLGRDGLRTAPVVIMEGRAEDFGHDELFRGKYDMVTARALAKMNVLLELSMPFLRVGGHLLAMKGPDYAVDLAEASHALEVLHGGDIWVTKVAIGEKQRYILDITKLSPTPKTYPRRTGIPNKRPL
ncbi:MAG: 16S rRNA (guanine(527)-N(7))-methyltransferase RsmG, partial [bacterium]|nr:16S rRNA (guanine(527)-N(7))-methyltransferase RsmG [bacterium]